MPGADPNWSESAPGPRISEDDQKSGGYATLASRYDIYLYSMVL